MTKNDRNLKVSANIENEIVAIKQDHIHGSTFLLHKAIKLFYSMISKKSDISKNTIEYVLIKLIQAQPTMASLVNFSNELLYSLSDFEKQNQNNKSITESINLFLETYEQKINNENEVIKHHAFKQFYNDDTIATYSSSGTVQKTIKSLARNKQKLHVFCSESRPKNEGTQLAKKLAEEGMKVYLMTDVTLYSQLKKADAIIIGSDAITYQGVINKMGSYPLAMIAKQFNIPFYCITSSQKILPKYYKLPDEPPKPPTDLIANTSNQLTVINYYFDTTPFPLITGFITEKGIHKSKDIKNIIKEKKLHPTLKKIMK